MPVKPENIDKYPDNWKQISSYIRFVRAKNHCEVCGVRNYSIIERHKYGKWSYVSQALMDQLYSKIKYAGHNMTTALRYFGFVKVILTTAHLDHNPENCDHDNLKAMCQKCHNSYDAEHRKQTRREAKLKGQLKLSI